MENILIYIAKSALSIAVFYLFYRLFLSKETFFNMNRIFLLSAIFISFALPAINFSYTFEGGSGTAAYILKIVEVSQDNFEKSVQNGNYSLNLLYIYFIGLLVSLAGLVIRYASILRLAHEAKKTDFGELIICRHHLVKTPFSFLSYLFLNPEDANIEELEQIIVHEKAHIRQNHTIDLLIIEIAKVIQWFNPFIYLIRKSIMENHEYIADNAVLNKGFDKQSYIQLLYNHISSEQRYRIANHFNYSLIKRRFSMMEKAKSNKAAKSKALLFLPIVVILALFISGSVNLDSIAGEESFSNIIRDKPTIGNQNDKMEAEWDVPPDFGYNFMDILKKNIKYPDEARKKGISGIVYVEIYVDNEAKIVDWKIKKGVHEWLDKEALRVVKLLPDLAEPAYKDGKGIKCQIMIPVNFKLK